MDGFVIDALAFCRLQESRAGESPVSDFLRLAGESVGKVGMIQWSVRGDSDKFGHPQLHLVVTGSIELICQRCLKPISHVIDSEAVLVLAADDAEADRIEKLVGEDVDVIVAPQSFDLAALIEDEALLALPLSPRHEVCPDRTAVAEHQQSASPFSALKNWKQ